MLRVVGIVAEYNPFHNGHKFLIDFVRQRGDAVVAVMSGNFVQRGDAAVFDKFARACAALKNGVDLVLELPVESALSGANSFAAAAVGSLISAGATHIAFGSECGDLKQLYAAADAVDDERVNLVLSKKLTEGMSYAKARSEAVSEVFGASAAKPLETPNDILAVEYLRAIRTAGSDITPIAVKRAGARHDGQPRGNIASALELRRMILQNEDYQNYVPESAYNIYSICCPARLANAGSAIIWQLRQFDSDYFSNFDVSEGLHNRIYSAVRKKGTLTALEEAIKTKRYPLARIRRVLLSAVLETHIMKCPYLRVLGFTQTGERLLRGFKKPVVTSYKTAKAAGAAKYFEQVSKITDFYALCMDFPAGCGTEFVQSVLKI